MYRYLILIWENDNPQAAGTAQFVMRRLKESAPGLTRVMNELGIAAFEGSASGASSCETRLFAGRRRGAVFGRVFRTGLELAPGASGEMIDAVESERICITGGRHLLERYWGRYVAVFRDRSDRTVHVLRDPTGGLPCFIAQYKGVHLVFSDMEDCLRLGLIRFSINWRYIAAVVPYSALQIRETGLNEVMELQAGECAIFSNGRVEYALLWKPHEIAMRGRIVDPAQAITAVRETVTQCVHAWASLHEAVVHNLSGGLDSSIVLACLRSAPNNPRVTCLHYCSPSSNEDEREYARLVARHMSVDLVESELDPSAGRLETLFSVLPAPKPWFYIYDLLHGPVEARVVAERNASATFSGAGGDALFLQARAELAVADYLTNSGYRPGVFRVAHDAARINRASIWVTLKHGVRRHLRPMSRSVLAQFSEPRPLIPTDVFERARDDEALVHPWVRDTPALPPGLLWHILCLSVPAQFYHSFDSQATERTAVLMSQPLIELCLGIPSYVWITGGRDRAIARRAFADVLPQAVVRRTNKGLIDRFNRKMLDENVEFVRDILPDGLLVNAGLLDRSMLLKYIDLVNSPAGVAYNEVLRQHLCTEIWLRRWTELTTASEARDSQLGR